MNISGILNIHKPPGCTSFDVVRLVKRLSSQRRVGHGGTLDPLAEGVLPVCIGQATRVTQYLAELNKTYLAELALGASTDTYDVQGRIVQQKDPSYVTKDLVEKTLDSFRGAIEQTPPMYSAVKHRGEPLYKLARRGIEVAREKRQAHVFRLELKDWSPPALTIEVECGKGTYIRSIAHDLGQLLGCGAHLSKLVRTGCGPFQLDCAVSISELRGYYDMGRWRELLYPLDEVLLHWNAAILGKDMEQAILNGRPIQMKSPAPKAEERPRCRAYTLGGSFIAVLNLKEEDGNWRPARVFRPEDVNGP